MKYLLNIEVVVDVTNLNEAMRKVAWYEQNIIEDLDVDDVSTEVMEAAPDGEEDDE